MGIDPGLQKDGVEAHLQELLAADPEVIAVGLTLVRREHPTDIGPVDLLCRDAEGNAVAIEVKRRGDVRLVSHGGPSLTGRGARKPNARDPSRVPGRRP